MSEGSIFGIAKPQWEIIAAIATACSALASFAAVWVALHLANRAAIPRVKFRVGEYAIITAGHTGPIPEYVVFNVVNTGERVIRISQIGWRVGFFTKRFAMQTFDAALSSKLPVELSHGQEASYYVPLTADDPWHGYFARVMLMPNRRTACATLKATVITSVGHQFFVRPPRELMGKLRDQCGRLTAAQEST